MSNLLFAKPIELLNEYKPSSKIYKVLNHLISNGKITSWEAIQLYGYTRLSDAIYKLRNRGLNIISKNIVSKDRYGNPTNYVEYELKED